jgi:hypothetical protein
MPRIPESMLDSVFYLYRSRADAEAGEDLGGTGFFLGMPIAETTLVYVYAITNWHVAVNKGCSVIRVNKHGGGTDIFELDPSEWHFVPKGPDLAIADVQFDQRVHKIVYLHSNMLVTNDQINAANIGPGEDIFMIGRFMDHDGGDENVPAVRFGHISVMPQKIEQRTGAANRKSFILDVHSRTGYSGSPVFAYRTPFTDFGVPTPLANMPAPYSRFLVLLGVHWGAFPERWEIGISTGPYSHSGLPANAKYVEGFSGMSLAVPAYEILEFLDMPKLKGPREAATAGWRTKMLPKAEIASSAPESDNP